MTPAIMHLNMEHTQSEGSKESDEHGTIALRWVSLSTTRTTWETHRGENRSVHR